MMKRFLFETNILPLSDGQFALDVVEVAADPLVVVVLSVVEALFVVLEGFCVVVVVVVALADVVDVVVLLADDETEHVEGLVNA